MHPTPARSTPARAAWAATSGLAWGVALPDAAGVALLALGAWCAARALAGRPLLDAALTALAGLVWAATALASAHRALVDYGVAAPGAATVALVLAEGLPWALVGVVAGLGARAGLRPPVALGLAWTACVEPLAWLQPFPFPPAMLLAGAPVALWPVALGGAALASGLGVAVGAALPGRRAVAAAAVWAVAGAVQLGLPERGGRVEIGLVQPDVGPLDARRASTDDARAARLLRLVAAAGGRVVLTPEGAWPHDPGPEGSARRRAFAEAWRHLPPTVVGATVERGPHARNSLLAVQGGEVVARFDKHGRVPLTERAVAGWGEDAFARGTTPRTLTLAGLRLGPLICYEDLLPGALREAVAEAPDLLVLASHDGWFGGGRGNAWHLATARLAAVASGRWVARPTTSGISALIDARGRVRWSAPWVDGDAREHTGSAARVDARRTAPWRAGCELAVLWTAAAWLALAWAERRRRYSPPSR